MFYVFFIIVMIASMAAVGLVGFSGSTNTPAPVFSDEDLPEPTPFVLTYPAPAQTIDGTQPHVATIETNMGTIEVELATDAPNAVNSFAFLAGKGFYDGTAFFFVNDYFAQAGDPTCNLAEDAICSGVGGPGYILPREDSAGAHEQWAIVAPALGASGDDVHGSQFRVLYQDDLRLDGSETVFGTVTSGQEILESLGSFLPCSVAGGDGCVDDLSSALVIETIEVRPA
ncbi:MAG: peptidylprolyl isomerase [Chloroflexi bacterium]|nr:peptidylprolyl isomerase [Chloroflexota bacterium]